LCARFAIPKATDGPHSWGHMRDLLTTSMVIAFAVLVACDGESITDRARADHVQGISRDDPAMLHAFEKARASLDTFLSRVAAKDPAVTGPAVKVKVQDGDSVEYFWISEPLATPTGYVGTIDNQPEVVTNIRNGQKLTFTRSQIYDWTYIDAQSGKMLGNFTACALLAHESPEAVAELHKTYALDCDP
jgi:uncharacterized protein YegJ (DUF2314 family)